MKYSTKRELIKKIVKENKIHPTADDVYGILKPNIPTLSLGTVYRNLNFLSEQGIINKLHMPKGSDRFDGEIHSHHHVICNKCGKIFDIELSIITELCEKIRTNTGVDTTSQQLIISGICEDCNEKNTKLMGEI